MAIVPRWRKNMSIINKRIGIVGGGQLGKMMILEAKRLGFYVAVLDPAHDCPASSVCDEVIVAKFTDESAYFRLAEKVDVITYEFEHINTAALEKIEKDGTPVYPSVRSLKTIQNKYLQKCKLRDSGIAVSRLSKEYTADLGSPQMFKAALGSYDGKGNWVIRSVHDVPGNVDGFFEEFVDFKLEISVIACRGIDGTVVTYPVAENIHKNSILDMTVVPARISFDTEMDAEELAKEVMKVFKGVGTFCVEMFVDKKGKVSVNEVAPRPHNSGHYTIEGTFANQFENHIRAIAGLPLGCTEIDKSAVMVNLLGESDGKAQLVGLEQAYKIDPLLHVHMYGKSESKIGRKMGHFTVVSDDIEDTKDIIKRAEKIKSVVKVLGKSSDK